MKKLKNQKGITLVALIITIIILLILAVVALREITGNGIIAKAKEARSEYEEAQADENRLLAEYMTYLNNANSDGSGGNTGGNGGSTGGNEVNPWLSTDLASLPNSIYDTWYTGPMPEALGIPSLSVKLGSNGELIVAEVGIYTTSNDEKITIAERTLTYTESESMIITLQWSADGQKATVSLNGTVVGEILPPSDTNEEEKLEIMFLINQYRANPTEETKNKLLALGVNISNCIKVKEEIVAEGRYIDYFYSKGTKNLLFTDHEIIDVTEEQLIILNDLYEIALLADQQVSLREQGDCTNITVTYKGETIKGGWYAYPWIFEYGVWKLEPIAVGDYYPDDIYGAAHYDFSKIRYIGYPGLE